MGLLDNVLGGLGGNKDKHSHGKQNPQELLAKAQKLSIQHNDKINKAVDMLQDKIPGQKGDKLIDTAQRKFNDFAEKNRHNGQQQ